jgi:hypothetical protein
MNSPLLTESANYTVILNNHQKKDKLFIYIVLERIIKTQNNIIRCQDN